MGLKDNILNGTPLIGSFLGIASPPLAEMLGNAGYDFIVLDTEHGAFNPGSTEDCLRAASAAGIPGIVRTSALDAALIQSALDLGATGVQIPQIETAAQAHAAVHSSNFAPAGDRGYGSATRAAAYGFLSRTEVKAKAQKEVVVNIQIESKTGVDNLPAILAVEGIDIIFIGTSDLSMSYGYDSPNDPAMMPLVENVISAITKAGKIPGMHLSDWSKIEYLQQLGVRFFTVSAAMVIKDAFIKQVESFLRAVKRTP